MPRIKGITGGSDDDKASPGGGVQGEMSAHHQGDEPRRGAVTITNRGRPVAVSSPVPASEETHSGFIGMMRGTVVKW